MDNDTLHPLTLNEHLGALTIVWVVPLSDTDLTSAPRLPMSTTLKPSELDEKPSRFQPKTPDPYLYNFSYLDRGLTKAKFGGNQLLPGSIGFLPLIPS